MNNFEKMNQQGLEVQEIVRKHLAKRGNRLIDVSQDKAYQKKDIDFLVYKGDKMTTLEVKKDKNLFRTRNIFVECGFQRGNYFSSGWLSYCEADYICYFDTAANRGVIVDREKLLHLLDKGKVISFYDKTDDKMGKAVLVPLAVAKSAIVYEWRE